MVRQDPGAKRRSRAERMASTKKPHRQGTLGTFEMAVCGERVARRDQSVGQTMNDERGCLKLFEHVRWDIACREPLEVILAQHCMRVVLGHQLSDS